MVYFTFFLSMCSVLATFCHRPSRYGALLPSAFLQAATLNVLVCMNMFWPL